MFRSFEERGEVFKRAVRQVAEARTTPSAPTSVGTATLLRKEGSFKEDDQ